MLLLLAQTEGPGENIRHSLVAMLYSLVLSLLGCELLIHSRTTNPDDDPIVDNLGIKNMQPLNSINTILQA